MKLIPNLATIDKKAIEVLKIPSLLLMEEAGRHVATRVSCLIEDMGLKAPHVTVVCGRGNNGGDGFVCARRLAMLEECQVTVVATASLTEMSGDALTNFNLLKHYRIDVIQGFAWDRVVDVLNSSHVIVDALFGSGLSRPIEGSARELITAINESNALTVAVDLPSGVHSATGGVLGAAVHANHTVTFAAPKPGLFLFPGKGYAGQVEVVDIGIPQPLIDEDPSRVFLMTDSMIQSRLPKRRGLSHKYSYGTVLVVAGSRDMPGAAAMTAESALKAGAGVVILACPQSAFNRMQLSSEIICLSLPETEDGAIAPEAFDALRAVLSRVDTIALGPGMTSRSSVVRFVETFLDFLCSDFQGHVVIDADGLNCLSLLTAPPLLSPRFILTPHLGECSRLLGVDTETIQNDLLSACQKTADTFKATIVLKSASTVISGSNNRLWINPTGNPGMATAGSGDILTGFVAGFMAQGLSPDRAARVAVYLHGLSGDKAAENLTQYCLTATDLVRYLPTAIKAVQA